MLNEVVGKRDCRNPQVMSYINKVPWLIICCLAVHTKEKWELQKANSLILPMFSSLMYLTVWNDAQFTNFSDFALKTKWSVLYQHCCASSHSPVVSQLFYSRTISPSFREYRRISLISRPRPACFHWLRRSRRDRWSLPSSFGLHPYQQACPSGTFVNVWLILQHISYCGRGAPFHINFSCEYLHIISYMEHASWRHL